MAVWRLQTMNSFEFLLSNAIWYQHRKNILWSYASSLRNNTHKLKYKIWQGQYKLAQKTFIHKYLIFPKKLEQLFTFCSNKESSKISRTVLRQCRAGISLKRIRYDLGIEFSLKNSGVSRKKKKLKT